MKTRVLIAFALAFSCSNLLAQSDDDVLAIKKTLDSWNRGWAEKDAKRAVQDYASNADWTNAFGDRFQSRDDLQKGLEFIFSLDFVMAGTSGKNEFEDVTFLAGDIALLRSKLVRKGQKTAEGKLMPDRHVHHLRVLKKSEGQWKIVSHLISQAQPKTMARNTK